MPDKWNEFQVNIHQQDSMITQSAWIGFHTVWLSKVQGKNTIFKVLTGIVIIIGLTNNGSSTLVVRKENTGGNFLPHGVNAFELDILDET
mmetsp:Transcript_41217/g.41845  ORF Transcript_41217/g.41845 Transcript_41217/m.41845 type:complete len:90 (+) Transcript_41217:322-591(+)